MTPEEQKKNLDDVVLGLKQSMVIAGFLTPGMFVFPEDFLAIAPPQTFIEQLKDEFKRQGWIW